MNIENFRVLVVGVEAEVLGHFRHGFDRVGFVTMAADSVDEASRIIDANDIDTVIIDLESVGRKALGLIQAAKSARHDLEVIVLTRSTTVALAIEAMKLGVFDDLLVPVNLDALIDRVRAAGRVRNNRRKAAGPR